MMNCGCCVCCLIDEDYTGSALVDGWNVLSGTFTLDTGTDIATLSSGAVVSADDTLPTNSGMIRFRAMFTTDTTSIKFAYVDANNHYRLDCTKGTNPYTAANGVLCELYEVISGTPTLIADRWMTYSTIAPREVLCCWYEGGRVSVLLNATFSSGPRIIWPNHITGGNTFRIETTGTLTTSVIGVASLAQYCKHALDFFTCSCSGHPDCMLCPTEWGDTMQVEIMDGPHVGDIFTLDRFMAVTANVYNDEASYWRYYYFPTGSDHLFLLDMCQSGMGQDEIRLTVDPPDAFVATGSDTVAISDCEGPWDFVVEGRTYRLTPL